MHTGKNFKLLRQSLEYHEQTNDMVEARHHQISKAPRRQVSTENYMGSTKSWEDSDLKDII